MMKQALGATILLALFSWFAWEMSKDVGWRHTGIILGGSLATTALVVFAIFLLTGDIS